jgi:tripartite-type tricarboxylate transporter receptor subunit TctC
MIPALKKFLGAALLAAVSVTAAAQGYPTRTVKLVVPYGPGSSPDSVGRIIAQQMQESLGQTVIVSNVAGALANVGTAEVARAAPDGYTILLTTNTPHAANVALFKQLPFDPVRDFAPIVRLITTSMVLLVRADFPANKLKEFIAYAKTKTQGLNAGYGSAGPSSRSPNCGRRRASRRWTWPTRACRSPSPTYWAGRSISRWAISPCRCRRSRAAR